eukprot:5725447-Pleurochrysis_carterae.AAC.1
MSKKAPAPLEMTELETDEAPPPPGSRKKMSKNARLSGFQAATEALVDEVGDALKECSVQDDSS